MPDRNHVFVAASERGAIIEISGCDLWNCQCAGVRCLTAPEILATVFWGATLRWFNESLQPPRRAPLDRTLEFNHH